MGARDVTGTLRHTSRAAVITPLRPRGAACALSPLVRLCREPRAHRACGRERSLGLTMDSPTMNPLVRRGQEHRPAQPTAPLTAEEIRECGPVLTRWQSALSRRAHSLSPPPFALLTYLTDSASLSPWVLGLSAAAHGVPIIVVGAGMKWAGAGVKLPAARRAAQAVAAHEGLRGVALVFADGSDTAIASYVACAVVAAGAGSIPT